MEDLVSIIPPDDFYEDGGERLNPKRPPTNQVGSITEKIVCPVEGGTLVYHEGYNYPKKGWPYKEAMFSIDVVKRALMNVVRFISLPALRSFIAIVIILPGLRRKIVNEAIEQFAEYSNTVFIRAGTYLKPIRYCDMVREIYKVGMEMAGDNSTYQYIVKMVCMILEYDDAYRYRLQDALGEFDKAKFGENPAKEIVRLMTVFQLRDMSAIGGGTVAIRMIPFKRFVPYLFMIKSFKKGTIEFFNKIDIEKLKLDHSDWYWTLPWVGYDFGGLSLDHRLAMRQAIDALFKKQDQPIVPPEQTGSPVSAE